MWSIDVHIVVKSIDKGRRNFLIGATAAVGAVGVAGAAGKEKEAT